VFMGDVRVSNETYKRSRKSVFLLGCIDDLEGQLD
jgi:hypothetical protein